MVIVLVKFTMEYVLTFFKWTFPTVRLTDRVYSYLFCTVEMTCPNISLFVFEKSRINIIKYQQTNKRVNKSLSV